MAVTKETVLRTSRLARLDLGLGLSEAEAEARIEVFREQMDEIVRHMDMLAQADCAGVEPWHSPLDQVDGPRPDEPEKAAEENELLDGAPERLADFFVVPRIL